MAISAKLRDIPFRHSYAVLGGSRAPRTDAIFRSAASLLQHAGYGVPEPQRSSGTSRMRDLACASANACLASFICVRHALQVSNHVDFSWRCRCDLHRSLASLPSQSSGHLNGISSVGSLCCRFNCTEDPCPSSWIQTGPELQYTQENMRCNGGHGWSWLFCVHKRACWDLRTLLARQTCQRHWRRACH